MSDEKKDTTQPQGDEVIKNLKAEFDRKQSNLEAEVKQTNELLRSVLENTKKPVVKESPTSIKDVWYSDEEKAAQMIEDRATAKALKAMDEHNNRNLKVNKVAQEIINDFPEAQDQTSDLFKKASEIYQSLSAEEQSSPIAMKLAVKEAAMELDMKPRSKRGAAPSNDSYSMGGSSGSRTVARPEGGVAKETLEFAALMGLDTSDAKVRERLSKRSK